MQDVSTMSATELNPRLWQAAAKGTGERVRQIVKAGGEPQAFFSLALRLAAEAGNKGTTEALLESNLPLPDVKQALMIAEGQRERASAHNGHRDTANVLREWITIAERPKPVPEIKAVTELVY